MCLLDNRDLMLIFPSSLRTWLLLGSAITAEAMMSTLAESKSYKQISVKDPESDLCCRRFRLNW